ncbi:protein CCR4 [Kluyveromyces marxianus]|uniref:Protein CCR4 n=1 Tax=Kluyveromyces marxianus TaxID=4911 RepID=A0ABX6F665_KLUMA|nr:protein CCR4 [Kluyveromyces marxianus]
MDNHTELLTSLRHGQGPGQGAGQGAGQINGQVSGQVPKDKEEKSAQGSLADFNLSNLSDESVEKLQKLEEITLSHSNLSQLPGFFRKLTHLRALDLSFNKFTEIPAVLMQGGLALERLDLSNNSIAQLPQDFPEEWCEKLVSLKLSNNSLASIKTLYPLVTQLKHLKVLELDGNLFSNDVIEKVLQGFSNPKCSADEYWILALRKYFSDNNIAPVTPVAPAATTTTTTTNATTATATTTASTLDTQQKITRAAKRMGFIGNSHSTDDNDVVNGGTNNTSGNVNTVINSSSTNGSNLTSPQSDLDLYSHSKFNEYFKRLSVLPEEPNLQEVQEEQDEQNFKELLQTHHEKKKKSMENVVLACRKLLFTFTECQQNIRKITSLCPEKTISVNVVTQLYSLKSHIDNLVEVLEKFESNNAQNDPSITQTQFLHHDVLVRLCLTILSIFKKIFVQLRKNFTAFFGNNDVFFLRVFYMNILCSYTEIYNAWNLLVLDNQEIIKKKKLGRTHSVHSMNVPQYQKFLNNRQRSSSAINRSPSFNGVTSQQATLNSNTSQVTPPIHPNFTSTPLSNTSTTPPVSDSSPKPSRSVNSNEQSNVSISTQGNSTNEISNISTQNSTVTDTDIDSQLYLTLNTVIDMVNVVYSQLTQAITKSAIASTISDQLAITPTVAAKTKDLTDTCYQSMELSKVLKRRLHVISNNDVDKYLTTKEKLKTWEDINAFLKSIIAILANTKDIMGDLPTLNDVRPNLASLAKITKDVTVILDLSSYKSVSLAHQQNSSSTTSNSNGSDTTSQSQSTLSAQHLQQQDSSFNQQHQESSYSYQQQQQHAESSDHPAPSIVTPLSTPSLVTPHSTNPFDQL